MKHLVNDWIKTCNLPDIFLKASNEFSWQVVKLVFWGCNIPVDKYMGAGQFHFLSATLGSLTVDSPCRLSILIITFPFHSLRSRFCVNIFQVLKEPPDLLPYSPVRTFVGSLSRLRKPPKKSNFRTCYQIWNVLSGNIPKTRSSKLDSKDECSTNNQSCQANFEAWVFSTRELCWEKIAATENCFILFIFLQSFLLSRYTWKPGILVRFSR